MAALLAERSLLEQFVTGSFATSLSADELPALMDLIDAQTDRAVLIVIQRNPSLVSDRGESALSLLATAAQTLGLSLLLPRIEDRQAWLAQLVEAEVRPTRMRLPGD